MTAMPTNDALSPAAEAIAPASEAPADSAATASAEFPAEPKAHGERVSAGFIAAYCFAQFGLFAGLLTPVVVSIAIQVARIADPAQKAAQLGLLLGVGALGSLFATPIWGQLSDRTRARIGRRKLWMIVGIAGGGIGLLVMAMAPNMLVLGLGWLIAQSTFNACQAALNALLPDHVPPQQRGQVSGLLGLCPMVAVLVGTFMTQFTAHDTYLMFLAPWTLSAISLVVILFAFQDRPAHGTFGRFGIRELAKTFWVDPRRYPDYGWTWLSRFLVIMGAAYLQVYSVYLLSDHLGVPTADLPRLVFFNSLLGAGMTLIFSPLGGRLSDKVGRRKPFVLCAAILCAIGLLVIGFAASLPVFFIGSAIASIGIGVYYAVDLALVASVLPDPKNSAKDMGVFQIASTLPQSIAPATAPLFLAVGGLAGDSYAAVFIAAATFAVLGAFAIQPVRGTR